MSSAPSIADWHHAELPARRPWPSARQEKLLRREGDHWGSRKLARDRRHSIRAGIAVQLPAPQAPIRNFDAGSGTISLPGGFAAGNGSYSFCGNAIIGNLV